MAGPRDAARAVERQLCLYRALLVLYPASFRRRFGAEMVQLFGDRLRHGPDGAAGGSRMWAATLVDLAVSATQLRMEALVKPGPDRVPIVVALFLMAGFAAVAVELAGILAALPLAAVAVTGLALFRSDAARLLRRPADPAEPAPSVARRLLWQSWWAPLATAMAVVEIGLEPYFALTGHQDLPAVVIGGAVFTGLGATTLVGLLRRPGNRPLGNTLVLVGVAPGFSAPWMVWPPILAGLVWLGVVTSSILERRRPATVAGA